MTGNAARIAPEVARTLRTVTETEEIERMNDVDITEEVRRTAKTVTVVVLDRRTGEEDRVVQQFLGAEQAPTAKTGRLTAQSTDRASSFRQ